jgi:type I restriction enzyme R subunit
LRSFKLVDYTKEQVRVLYRSIFDIQQRWVSAEQRSKIIDQLSDRGIDFEDLKRVMNQPDADPFDLLCHLAFGAPVLTCKQRAERLRSKHPNFFEQYSGEAKEILEVLLQSYAERGPEQLVVPAALKVQAVEAKYGNVREIGARFGGVESLKAAIDELQALLYSA